MDRATATKTDRQRYLNKEISHADYYRAIAATAGVSYENADARFLDRVRRALAAGDEHLNTIPLAEWDARSTSIFGLHNAFRAHGDIYSLAGGVCLVKQAAKDAVEDCNG